jgi:hypothetical protein
VPRENSKRRRGLVVDPEDLVYCYDVGKEVGEEMYRMHVYYAVERAATTGTVAAGDDATDARFCTPEAFRASEHTLRDMPNPEETRSWKVGLDVLRDRSKEALQRDSTYADTFAPHVRK